MALPRGEQFANDCNALASPTSPNTPYGNIELSGQLSNRDGPPRGPEKGKAARGATRSGFKKSGKNGTLPKRENYPNARRGASRSEVVEAGRLDLIEVASYFRGVPNRRLSRERVLRWGNHGSFAVWLDSGSAGRFCDFETGESGDSFDLIQSETGLGFLDAVDWYAEQFMGEHPDRLTPARTFTAKEPRLRTDADDDEHRAKIERARLIWRHATPMEGTPAAGYLATRLGADLPGDLLAHPDLRFHPAPFYGGESTFLGDAVGGLVALMRDPLTGEPTGLHRTFISVGLHRLEKRMLGRKGMVMLSPFDSVSHGLSVCEGIETGVAIMHRLGFAPVWCALSAGGVGTFPALPGVDALTVFADNDLPDKNGRRAGQMAADRCAQRWREEGREVRVVTPTTPDSDFADEVAQ